MMLVACSTSAHYELICEMPDNRPEAVVKRIFQIDALPASMEIIECKAGVFVTDPNGTDRNVCALHIDPQDFEQLLARRSYSAKPYSVHSGFIETLKVDSDAITTRYYLHNVMHPGHMMFSNAERTYVVAYGTFEWCHSQDEVVN